MFGNAVRKTVRKTASTKKTRVRKTDKLFKELTEYQECKIFYAHTQDILRLGKTIFKQVNEGKREGWWGKALQLIGLTPGVCDYQYIIPNDKYCSLWIEMKRSSERGKKTRKEQDEFICILLAHGHYATYAYGATDAIQILHDYMANRL